MTTDAQLDFEQRPTAIPKDETDYSVRAYVARLPEERIAEYDPSWSDEQVMDWDGNFRSDGGLMLVCCERDVDVHEFRHVIEEYRDYLKARVPEAEDQR